MKLGIALTFSHSAPEEWALRHKEAGLSAVIFPCSYDAPVSLIDEYVNASKNTGLTIAEVGVWKNILDPDPKVRQRNFDICKQQLALADYVGAACCVNISGAIGPVWDGGYRENYTEKTYEQIIESVQSLIDSVKPRKTCYSLEPMPWMHPDSPEDYLQMIQDIDRSAFGVHLDMVNMINDPKKYLFNREYTNHTIALLKDHIKSCHIKDVCLENELTLRLKEVPCGEGGFDLKNYLDQIDAIDTNMPMIIEHLNTEEEFRNAITCIQGLTKE